MVLLILAVVWAAILASWYRARHEKCYLDSVGTFRRHLNVIERVAPATVRAANSRRGPRGGLIPPYRPPGAPRRRPGYAVASRGAGPGVLTPPLPALARHRRSQKRRRDVFFVLLAGVAGTAVLSALPALRAVLYVQVALDVCFVAYMALLVRMRNLAAEREMKLRYLESARARKPLARDLAARRPALAGDYASSFDYSASRQARAARPGVVQHQLDTPPYGQLAL